MSAAALPAGHTVWEKPEVKEALERGAKDRSSAERPGGPTHQIPSGPGKVGGQQGKDRGQPARARSASREMTPVAALAAPATLPSLTATSDQGQEEVEPATLILLARDRERADAERKRADAERQNTEGERKNAAREREKVQSLEKGKDTLAKRLKSSRKDHDKAAKAHRRELKQAQQEAVELRAATRKRIKELRKRETGLTAALDVAENKTQTQETQVQALTQENARATQEIARLKAVQEAKITAAEQKTQARFLAGQGLDRLEDSELSRLEDQVKEEREGRRKCVICMDRNACMVFFPCKHMRTCEPCSAALQTCPICREVQSKFKLFT
jgi:E3 ubiquitin-protein ligase BOI-like protein